MRVVLVRGACHATSQDHHHHHLRRRHRCHRLERPLQGRSAVPPHPTHTPAPVDRQTLIYAAVLRQYLTSGDAAIAADYRFPHIFVVDHAVADAGASGPGTSEGGPIPPAARRAIIHALIEVGPLTYVASGNEAIEPHSCANVRGDGILITLGPVEGTVTGSRWASSAI
jgi:hypothetical protein